MIKRERTEAMSGEAERNTPYDQDAEAGVLGAMLLDREAIGLAIVHNGHITNYDKLRRIYEQQGGRPSTGEVYQPGRK